MGIGNRQNHAGGAGRWPALHEPNIAQTGSAGRWPALHEPNIARSGSAGRWPALQTSGIVWSRPAAGTTRAPS
jgi:hypothetical protein